MALNSGPTTTSEQNYPKLSPAQQEATIAEFKRLHKKHGQPAAPQSPAPEEQSQPQPNAEPMAPQGQLT